MVAPATVVLGAHSRIPPADLITKFPLFSMAAMASASLDWATNWAYSREPTPGITRPIAIPARARVTPHRARHPIPRPRCRGACYPSR